MSLRDEIKDLRNIARILDRTNFNFEMNALEKFLYGIKVDKPAEPPEDILKPLLAKFLSGERNFSSRELRHLPFIIYEPKITDNHTVEILRELDFSKTSHLRGVLRVYLDNYDGSNKTELLKQKLNNVRNVDSVSLKKTFAAKEYLFADERFNNMSRLFKEKLSVERSLETLGLAASYKDSNFIRAALIKFFRTNMPPATQFKLLEELDADYDTYKNIFPAVADALIQTVVRSGFGKNKCIEIFYKRLGNPRFGNSRFNWNTVSQKTKDIFSQWLSTEDLEIFFKIVNATASDKQWKYREKFWRAYLPNIIKTKIFLGNDAKRLAAQIKSKVDLRHGTLRGSTANQSVFVFQIGRHIFSEWSHNGKLRVHEVEATFNLFDTAEALFENDSISRDVLVRNFIAEWTHYPHEGQNSWQGKVRDWMRKNY